MLITDDDYVLGVAEEMLNICEGKKNQIFDGFYPLVPKLYDGDESGFFFTDVTPSCLENPVNVSVFRAPHQTGSKINRLSQFYRVRQISRKELRKKAGIFAVNPYELEFGYDDKSVRSYKLNNAFFTFQQDEIKLLDVPNNYYPPQIIEQIKQVVRTCLAAQFNLENMNYVYLKPDNAEIGFSLPLDNLSQVKELFALRDIPDGKKRRAALKHWVAAHLRRKPNKEEQIEIKKYLRGKHEFSWFGMNGEIHVNV